MFDILRRRGRDQAARREQWEARYREREPADARPAEVLLQNLHLLPPRGRALDLACGLGANALLLAREGLETEAWDYAGEAVAKLAAVAGGLPLTAQVRDVIEHPPAPARYDVIVVAHFLHRPLIPALVRALRPGGLIFYQTFTRERVSGRGPGDDTLRLGRNELLKLFKGLTLVVYREEGRVGDPQRGLRDVAQLVAQKP